MKVKDVKMLMNAKQQTFAWLEHIAVILLDHTTVNHVISLVSLNVPDLAIRLVKLVEMGTIW